MIVFMHFGRMAVNCESGERYAKLRIRATGIRNVIKQTLICLKLGCFLLCF